MDYGYVRNEPRMDADQDETLAEFRSTNEPPDRRYPYHQSQVRFDPNYRGPLTDIDEESVRVMFRELLDYTNVCSEFDWPLPPTGLPGFLNLKRSPDSREAALIEIGLNYLYAVVNRQPRAMHLRWNDARDFIHGIENEAETRTETRIMMEEFDRARDTTQAPQRVYFIGAETGPIKIGIAANPIGRLRTLQTGHHERLELLATCDGGMTQERAYHKRFAAHRLNGEWFERAPEIIAEIERLPTLHP